MSRSEQCQPWHTPGREAGQVKDLGRVWGIPGAQTGGFSCFGMAGCMGKEEGMRIRIPEQDKRSEHQVGPSPGRAENPINPD